jgi:hypothetical protein
MGPIKYKQAADSIIFKVARRSEVLGQIHHHCHEQFLGCEMSAVSELQTALSDLSTDLLKSESGGVVDDVAAGAQDQSMPNYRPQVLERFADSRTPAVRASRR